MRDGKTHRDVFTMRKQEMSLLVESVPAQELELVWYLPCGLIDLTKKMDLLSWCGAALRSGWTHT